MRVEKGKGERAQGRGRYRGRRRAGGRAGGRGEDEGKGGGGNGWKMMVRDEARVRGRAQH